MADDHILLSLDIQPVTHPRRAMVVGILRQLQLPILRILGQMLHGPLDIVQSLQTFLPR